MGTAAFQSFTFYFAGLGGAPLGTGDAGYTLTDNTPSTPSNVINDEFTVGEGMTVVGSPALDGTYIGTYVNGGDTFFVVDAGGGNYKLYSNSPLASASYPATFTASDAAGVTAATYPACFFAGTRIATETGDIAVEHLQIGDSIQRASGKVTRVKWIGLQTVSTRFGPAARLMPVRLAAGSLGDGLPHTDLTVTADHGMLVDGVICHAGALVNGATITRVPLSEMGGSYTVYHIETEAHEIILANGAPAETFIDNVSRRAFDNFAEFDALYGDVPEMVELHFPRAMSERQVPAAIRTRQALVKAA